MSNFRAVITCCLTVLVLTVVPCRGMEIVLDYSDDSFFAAHPTAEATLEAAAQDVSNAITTTLAATVDTNSATVNGTSVTFNYNFNYANPTTGAIQTIDAALPANQVRVFVGVQNLTSGTLGEGEPGGFNVSSSAIIHNQSDVSSAVHMAAAAANANLGRGGGPAMGTASGSLTTVPYSIAYGPSVGSIWFNSSVNWQFDDTQPVAAGQFDFYTAALQEILQSLGFSTSQSWYMNVSGTDSRNWLGRQVGAQLEFSTHVLAPDSMHIAQGLMSPRLTDGLRQTAVMEPTLTDGVRESLTLLDLAFLRDIGWQTIESNLVPGDFDRDTVRTAADVSAMQRALTNLGAYQGQNSLTNAELLSIGDLNGDGKITNADLQSLLKLLINPAAGSGSLTGVSEPASLPLAGIGILTMLYLRKSVRRWS
ncbi:MAG TPA: dockerin type I domain-containing protein [Pirellulales bacterium]|nr:dockerin type I domain-containing protein [Pirellulales bacterium]